MLEHKSVWEALTRSFALVRDAFWRVLGIRVLAGLLTLAVVIAVSVPFSIAAAIVAISSDSLGTAVFATVVAALGSAIGQVIAMPFIAAVSVLLYTDRRFRVERFDLLLHSGTHQTAGSYTDDIWMTGS